MKNIFKIHPLTYILLLIVVFTAHFKLYLCFMLLLSIHELGHVLAGLAFNWNLKEIIILPLGMLTKYDMLINTPLNEELAVASMGIIFQLIFYFLFFNNSHFYFCNLVIIIFNLMPIYPLDGYKILNIILNKFFSFKTSYDITLYISFAVALIIIIISLINRYLILIIVFTPLIIGLFKEYKQRSSVFNKFYLERYLYAFSFNSVCYINNINIGKMKRDYYHYFKVKDHIIKEEEVLAKLFDKD